MDTFKVTRVFADDQGESHFEDVIYPLTEGGPIGNLSQKIKVNNIMFRMVKPTYNDLHTAPERQYVVLLDGGVEIETSVGEKRIFKAGEVLLMEDTTGKGHRSRNIKPEPRSSIFITFED